MGQMEVDNRSFINGLEDSILQNTIPFSSDETAQNVVNLQESANSTAKSHLENKALRQAISFI